MVFRCFALCSALVLSALGCAADEEGVLPVETTEAVGGSGGAGEGGAPDAGDAGAAGEATVVTLIDDFEDGDVTPLLGGGWYSYTDLANGGGSVLTFGGESVEGDGVLIQGEGFESERSLLLEFALDQDTLSFAPYVGLGVWLVPPSEPLDIGGYVGLTYTYRGSAHRVRIETFAVTDYDHFGVDIGASTEWKTIELPLAQFTQEGWGTAVAFDKTDVGNISFQIRGATGDTGTLELDDLGWYSGEAAQVPDMVINDPEPPADEELESIAIDNPLQERAMAHLSRGYNITNWLEQGRFTGFTYDEAFVESLAAAGFESLRLPIDLDLYVTEAIGTGDEITLTLSDDLFSILDSFESWTATHGLSLTIDYHQYDSSLNLAEPSTVDQAVALWGLVAAHFADNPREDLFFELLNEPDMSFSGTLPTKDEWTALAERMIAAIRAHDTTHSILFGDVQWYGIDELVTREPFADQNVIYVVHVYDPFIFTHQGASWANMASTHDIPYPYEPARWSEYFSELGFGTSMPTWILSAARNYYRTGNKATLRNRLVAAKRWAVTHQVPVICNEFGAYPARAPLEDRVRYLTDMRESFEELEIPWQHWFMTLDAEGQISPPEYAAAFGLEP